MHSDIPHTNTYTSIYTRTHTHTHLHKHTLSHIYKQKISPRTIEHTRHVLFRKKCHHAIKAVDVSALQRGCYG